MLPLHTRAKQPRSVFAILTTTSTYKEYLQVYDKRIMRQQQQSEKAFYANNNFSGADENTLNYPTI